MFVSSFSGCQASEEDVGRGQYIDDEEDLIDYIEEGICGDIDGDGVPDCPLSGYIEGTDPWWCTSSGIGGHHVDPAYENAEKGRLEKSPEIHFWNQKVRLGGQLPTGHFNLF